MDEDRFETWLQRRALLGAQVIVARLLASLGMTVNQIRAALGMGWHQVRKITRQRGIYISPPRPYGAWDPVDWTLPNAVIAREMGMSASATAHRRMSLRRQGKDIPPSPRRGGRPGPHRGTRRRHERWARRIRALSAKRLTAKDIARRLGISLWTVREVAKEYGCPLRDGRGVRVGRRYGPRPGTARRHTTRARRIRDMHQ